MSNTTKRARPEKDPDASGQLLIRRPNRDLDWIRESAEARGMEYRDYVWAACLEYAGKKNRLVPYLDPEALPTLQHLTAELQRNHRDLSTLEALLKQIRRALPGGDPEDEPDAENSGLVSSSDSPPAVSVQLESVIVETRQQTEAMRKWTLQVLQRIWEALR